MKHYFLSPKTPHHTAAVCQILGYISCWFSSLVKTILLRHIHTKASFFKNRYQKQVEFITLSHAKKENLKDAFEK